VSHDWPHGDSERTELSPDELTSMIDDGTLSVPSLVKL